MEQLSLSDIQIMIDRIDMSLKRLKTMHDQNVETFNKSPILMKYVDQLHQFKSYLNKQVITRIEIIGKSCGFDLDGALGKF